MAPLLTVRVLEFALVLLIFHDYSSESHPSSCFDQPEARVNSIPDSHLYDKKQKPLIIGHHGNPSKFQENTIDGFKSLAALKADGMELDTFLTKDGKLKLTGKNHNIWDINYENLNKLDINSK
ncbi:hypothetical protein P5673_019988 [Acropora cervicornis]|uniref:GP-PDE domain-containing protein n=1 Tax=Acropora cervicornis TaxID=6130 RepID=A0AAD9QB46_ACRCE|nr:hypothetical protein P5673_019988 [Acropora cervicornis]